MDFKDHTGILPAQYTGKEISVFSEIRSENEDAAKELFKTVKHGLLSINQWHEIAKLPGTIFQLMDKSKNAVSREAKKNDYLQITIPGPGNSEGDGYDWVIIEDIKETETENINSIAFRVRPVSNPHNDNGETAHFYDNSSTSSFILTREYDQLQVAIIDNNTKPNTDGSTFTNKLRNAAVGLAAVTAFSKLQWQNLADGLLKSHQ